MNSGLSKIHHLKIEYEDLKKRMAKLMDIIEEKDKQILAFQDQLISFRSEIQQLKNQRARKKKPKNNNHTPRRSTQA